MKEIRVIERSANYILGGYINLEYDTSTPVPDIENLIDEIYEDILSDGLTPKEIRFLGESKIREIIKNMLEKDEYFQF